MLIFQPEEQETQVAVVIIENVLQFNSDYVQYNIIHVSSHKKFKG